MQTIKDEVVESYVPFIKVEKLDDTPFIRDIVIKVEDVFKDVQYQDSSCSDVPSVRQPTSNKILFSCYVCDKQFFHKSELLSHTLHYHDDQHLCDICGLGFAKDDHLQHHKNSHGKPTPETQHNSHESHRSKVCTEKFIDNYELRANHSNLIPTTQHNSLDSHQSRKSSKNFVEKYKLKLNAKTHSLKKRYSCPVCGRAFIYHHRLNKHMALHTGTYPYSCNICNRGFSYKCSLKQHESVHREERPFSCNICHARFKHNHHLKKHVDTHIAEKKYCCETCGDCFHHKGNLTVHMLSHSEKKYRCTICKRAFGRTDHLSTHLRTHTGEKPYSCDVCSRSFGRSHSLKVHVCGKPERNRSKNKDCAFRSRKQPQLNGDDFCDADCRITRSKSKSTHQKSKLDDIDEIDFEK